MRNVKLTTVEKASTIIIYDFSNLAYSTYFAFNKMGGKGPILYGTLKKIISNLKELSDDKTALIFALDNFPQHKCDLVKSYKANRKRLEADEDPRPMLKQFLSNTKTYFAEEKSNEADDVIASLVAMYPDKQVIIVSADQDLLQLKVFEHVEIFNLIKQEFFDIAFFKKKYGLNKWKYLAIYKACFGDTSDNIKPALPRVRKINITDVINKTNGTMKSFVKEFWRSFQSKKTKEVFNRNKVNLKNNYAIVKLNKKLKVDLIRNKPNDYYVKQTLKKYKIKTLSEIDFLL